MMNRILEKINSAAAGRIWESALAETSVLKFQSEVIKSCEMNQCGMYNKTWMCPPGVGTPEVLQRKYCAFSHVYVFTAKHDIEDSFDIEGMAAARVEHRALEDRICDALAGENFLMLGGGGCSLCRECTYPTAPCRYPERARPAAEACGINVVELSQDVGIHYVNGANTVTYFSLVFFEK